MSLITIANVNDSTFAAAVHVKCIEEAVDEVAVRIAESDLSILVLVWYTKELDAVPLRCLVVAAHVSKDDGTPVPIKLNQASTLRRLIGGQTMHNEVDIGKSEKVHVSIVLMAIRVLIDIISAYHEVTQLRVSPNGKSRVAEKTSGAKINLRAKIPNIVSWRAYDDSFLYETYHIDKGFEPHGFTIVSRGHQEGPLLDRVVPIGIADVQIGVQQRNRFHGRTNAREVNGDSEVKAIMEADLLPYWRLKIYWIMLC